MAVLDETRYGCQGQTATLRRVLLRAPRAEDCARWREFGWRAEPDAAAMAVEHEALAGELPGPSAPSPPPPPPPAARRGFPPGFRPPARGAPPPRSSPRRSRRRGCS